MAVAVQNLAVSSWIGRKPFKWSEIGRELGNACLLVIVHEMMSTLWKQFIGAILDDFLGTRFTKNTILSTWKMKSGFFLWNMSKSLFGNIACHPTMNTCANFGLIWINYVMNVAKTLLLHLESYECSFVISSFWEHFFHKTFLLQVYFFFS